MTDAPQSFVRRYIFSTDHKVIGIQYIGTGLVMALVGALLSDAEFDQWLREQQG